MVQTSYLQISNIYVVSIEQRSWLLIHKECKLIYILTLIASYTHSKYPKLPFTNFGNTIKLVEFGIELP